FDRNGNKVQTTEVGAGVLKLGVGQGGTGTACITSTVPFSGAELRMNGVLKVDLGGMGIHYAYIRYRTDVRHECPINPSADFALCGQQTEVQLMSNPNISVTWSLEGYYPYDFNTCEVKKEPAPCSATVTSGGKVTGLNADEPGEYVFVATAADGCTDRTVLRYNMFPDGDKVATMGNALVNKNGNEDYVLSKELYDETSGALIIIDKLKDAEAVIDANVTNAATWGGLEIADNQCVMGVKSNNGINIVDYDRDYEAHPKGLRVGFVVSPTVTGLNLNLLKFWNIRCFHKGTLVHESVIDESTGVSVGLAGSSMSSNTRYSITLPWYDKKNNKLNIDEIQLWSSGVLGFSGSELSIYYAFVEDSNENGADPLKYSATLLSSATTHTTVDYALFADESLVSALGAIDNISYIVDDDLNTALTCATTNVAGRTIIPIKLGRTLDFRNEIGIVMRNESFLADVNLGQGMVVYTMYQGKKTGDEFTEWKVLGVDVGGYGDKQVFYIHPKRLFDEIVIDCGEAAKVLPNTKFFGLVMRSDADGDGAPDILDPSSCTSTIGNVEIDDVCEGSEIYIEAKGIPGCKYIILFNDPSIPAKDQEMHIDVDPNINTDNEADNNIIISYHAKTAGQHQVTFCQPDGTPIKSVSYSVHPTQTEWRKNAANSDWHNWTNWTKGTPYCCTDVIIPSDASVYPSLTGSDLGDHGDMFCCNRILIRPGGNINGVTRLNYSRAWVQLELTPNCYNLLSAPLKDMVTGDMFIPKAHLDKDPEPFSILKYKNATGAYDENDENAENRFNPTIYQRMWYKAVQDREWKTTEPAYKDLTELEEFVDKGITLTKWSKNFNHLNTAYSAGTGFSLWVDNGTMPDNTRFRFTFPKEYTQYMYFDDFSQMPITNVSETITRTETNTGRFIYESGTATNYEWSIEQGSTKSLVKYNPTDSTWVEMPNGYTKDAIKYDRNLYGLDFTTTIQPQETTNTKYFLFGNPFMCDIDVRKFIKKNNIEAVYFYDGNVAQSISYDATKDEFTNNGVPDKIPAMTAVFVKVAEEQEELTLSVTDEMITLDLDKDDSPETKGLRVSVQSGEHEASMSILSESTNVNKALFDNEIVPELAIFSTLDDEACDVVPAANEVPLAIIARTDNPIVFSFYSNDVNRDDWSLVDKVSGQVYPLDHDITLPAGTGTSSGRFCLVRGAGGGITTGIESIKDFDTNVYVTVNDNEIVATATEGNISSMDVYALSGIKVGEIVSSQPSLSIKVTPGIYVVRVVASNKISTHKIMVR
ncbi:MAG: T9SS type A sorting domain-containing protein, partial [Muribaculum sp.]|nr:T9SS type A sorting domain-containing protein [Muribaculum sp.]